MWIPPVTLPIRSGVRWVYKNDPLSRTFQESIDCINACLDKEYE